MLRTYFLDHPASVGEDYAQHLQSAWRFAGLLFTACLCCLVHGLLPFLFERTGSSLIKRLHEQMVENRSKLNNTPARTPLCAEHRVSRQYQKKSVQS